MLMVLKWTDTNRCKPFFKRGSRSRSQKFDCLFLEYKRTKIPYKIRKSTKLVTQKF